MKLNFNVTGKARKALVKAINEILGEPMYYLGAPTFSYIVGDYTIHMDGAVTAEGCTSEQGHTDLIIALNERGYIPEVADRGDTVEDKPDEAPDRPTAADNAPRATHEGMTIALPKDGFTEATLANLERLLASKAALIKKALGAETLAIEQSEGQMNFPWFSRELSQEELAAYTKFICALAAMAKEQTRITAREREVENEKYTMRCFLLRLGFIGAESKVDRKVLLARLSGNSSFKSGQRKGAEEAETGVDSTTPAHPAPVSK